jgi:hypothetical protein
VFLILGLIVYFLYTFVFDPRVERYEKSKMLVLFCQYFIWNYIIIQYNGGGVWGWWGVAQGVTSMDLTTLIQADHQYGVGSLPAL